MAVETIDFDALTYKEMLALAEKINALLEIKRNEAIEQLINETKARFAEFDLDPAEVFGVTDHSRVPSFLTDKAEQQNT
jgi:hypothetical protein